MLTLDCQLSLLQGKINCLNTCPYFWPRLLTQKLCKLNPILSISPGIAILTVFWILQITKYKWILCVEIDFVCSHTFVLLVIRLPRGLVQYFPPKCLFWSMSSDIYVPLTNPDEKLWGGGDFAWGPWAARVYSRSWIAYYWNFQW